MSRTNNNDIDNRKLIRAMEAMRENNNVETTSAFLNILISVKLLVPVSVKNENQDNSKDNIFVKDGTTLTFKSVVNTENDSYLITFTDWSQLKNWNSACKQAIIVDYYEILEIVMQENPEESQYEGFVINPFTNNHILSKRAIRAINNALSKK